MIVPVAAEMYAVCAIRYVSRQMVPEACNSAEGFVFEEEPATNSVYCIHYYCCLQILVWQISNRGYTCIFSQDFNQTGLCAGCSHCSIFIAKLSRSLAASVFPMKFTMSTSPPLATSYVIRRRAATSSLFQGPVC